VEIRYRGEHCRHRVEVRTVQLAVTAQFPRAARGPDAEHGSKARTVRPTSTARCRAQRAALFRSPARSDQWSIAPRGHETCYVWLAAGMIESASGHRLTRTPPSGVFFRYWSSAIARSAVMPIVFSEWISSATRGRSLTLALLTWRSGVAASSRFGKLRLALAQQIATISPHSWPRPHACILFGSAIGLASRSRSKRGLGTTSERSPGPQGFRRGDIGQCHRVRACGDYDLDPEAP